MDMKPPVPIPPEDLFYLVKRCEFADWFYIRTGQKVTSEEGEKLFEAFLNGSLIKVQLKWEK